MEEFKEMCTQVDQKLTTELYRFSFDLAITYHLKDLFEEKDWNWRFGTNDKYFFDNKYYFTRETLYGNTDKYYSRWMKEFVKILIFYLDNLTVPFQMI